jgi:hypothetical protein
MRCPHGCQPLGRHLGGLEVEMLAKEVRERVPTEVEEPREAPHEPLRSPVTGDEDGEQSITGHQ